MENAFLKNKIIIKYCPDYYRIINERFSSLDYMSDKIIQIYQSFIFKVEPRNKTELKRAITLNKALVKFFEDREFKTELSNELKTLKAPRNTPDLISFIVDTILKKYNKYLEGYTRNLYIPKWI